MLDWVTLRIGREHVPCEAWARLYGRAGHVLKVDAAGCVEWSIPARESVRSDSHQVTIRVTNEYLEISGSPARVHSGNNVFGSGSLMQCVYTMVAFVEDKTAVDLSFQVFNAKVTRVDVTLNYQLGSSAEVRQVLLHLRHADGGRYQVQNSAETVYWSAKSRMKSGKAYHKGPHALYQVKRGQAEYSIEEIDLADKLLRLELALRSQWWQRFAGDWWSLSEDDLMRIHFEYFSKLVGSVEIVAMDNLLMELEKHAPTKGQAVAAFRTWSLIKSIGLRETQASMPVRTFTRHKAVLFAAGLTWTDFQPGNVIPLRRQAINLGAPVHSWDEMRERVALRA